MQEAHMNSNKPGQPPESKPDDLVRSNTVELNEEQLGSVNGGIKIGSKAESLRQTTDSVDRKPTGMMHIESQQQSLKQP
jgi:hypothetical protein